MEKINIAELLKDCPKGMELDCTIFEDASNAYSRAKEAIIKSIAKEYYDKGLLTEKTYNGLISFKVCN